MYQQQAGLVNLGNVEPLGNGQGQEGLELVHQPPIIKPYPLYDRFCRMVPTEFEGSTNLLDAEEWL